MFTDLPIREVLDGWESGALLTDGSCVWMRIAYKFRSQAEECARQTAFFGDGFSDYCVPEDLRDRHDKHHVPFDEAHGDLVQPGEIDDYVELFGEPDVRTAAGLHRSLIGGAFTGGISGSFHAMDKVYWTPPVSTTALGAKLAAIAAAMTLDRMFGKRRSEVAVVRFGEPNIIEQRVEVTRGPEVRVYYLAPWLAELVRARFGGDA